MTKVRQYIRVADVCATSEECKSVLERFIAVPQAFVISPGADGVVFKYISGSRTARFGLRNGIMLPGKTVEAILRSLLLHDGDLDMVLSEVATPQVLFSMETWMVRTAPAEDAEPCYRTYLSSADLNKVLSFPLQKEYEGYGDVYVVTATTSLRHGETLPRITLPLEMRYAVICPKGVEADPEVVLKGERMTLTFTKPGFTSQSITLSAGSPSPFVKYEGAAILVNPLESVGINFTRRIPVVVRSSKGRAVDGYTITVNDRPVNTSRPFIDLTERDLAPGNTVEIVVKADTFRDLVVKLPAEKADVDKPLELVLQPERHGITLLLNFADGTVVEHDVAFERTDARYQALCGGSYCGFRARLVSEPGDSETYEVDVRAGENPVEIRKHSDNSQATYLAEGGSAERSINTADGREHSHRPARRRRKSYVPTWIICGGIVLAVVLAVYAVLYLPDWFNTWTVSENEPVAVDVTGMVSDTISDPVEEIAPVAQPAPVAVEETSAAPVPPVEVVPIPTATLDNASGSDIKYLNTAKVWKRSELTSEEGRRIYDLLGSGDIDAILSDPYFRRSNASINPTAAKIADLLWQAKDTPTQRSNETTLRKIKGEPSINLWTLYENLARVRPGEPHKGSRP